MQAGSEILRAVGPVGYFMQEQFVEFGIGSVGVDHRLSTWLDMALMQGDEDGSLIGEVLVDRADADLGNFGDAIGGE